MTQRADESSRTREGFQPAPPPANNNSYTREGFQPAPPPANSLVGQQLSGVSQSTGQEQQLFAGVQAASAPMAVGAAGDPGLFSTQAAATAAPSLQPGYAQYVRSAFPSLAHLPDIAILGQPLDAIYRLAREEKAAEGRVARSIEQRAHNNAVKAAANPQPQS